MRAIDFDQNPKPLLIGERVNAQGSRKVKRLLLAEDYDGISNVAREQVESGAHVLDVCVAVTERGDEAEQMAKVVKLLSMTVETPIMKDFGFPEGANMKLMAKMMTPLGFGQPEEVAGLFAFLASDEARYITAVTLPVDAGSTQR